MPDTGRAPGLGGGVNVAADLGVAPADALVQFAPVLEGLTLPLIDVVHNHSITRLVLTGSRASFPRTSSG